MTPCPQAPAPRFSKLMVAGGRGANSDVEFIDMDNANAVCSKPKDIPLTYMTVGTYMNEKSLVCSTDNLTPDCYYYDPLPEGTGNLVAD